MMFSMNSVSNRNMPKIVSYQFKPQGCESVCYISQIPSVYTTPINQLGAAISTPSLRRSLGKLLLRPKAMQITGTVCARTCDFERLEISHDVLSLRQLDLLLLCYPLTVSFMNPPNNMLHYFLERLGPGQSQVGQIG